MAINIEERLQKILINKPDLVIKVSKDPIVYGYVRVSTTQQSKQGKSLQAQEEMIRKYCSDNHLSDPLIIIEPGYSGKSIDARKEFLTMRDSAKKGDTIIVYSMSRIARSVKEISSFIYDMEKRGVRVVILDKEIDLTTAHGRLFFNMLATFDQFEREIDSERTSATLQSMKREGKLITKAPYGFKIEGGKLVENEEEMKMIDLIITYIHEDKKIKVSEICRRLQFEVDQGNIKLRKTNKVHSKTIDAIIKRHNIRTTEINIKNENE
ncbi:MAG: recombinase family protein [Methanobacterium sp.]